MPTGPSKRRLAPGLGSHSMSALAAIMKERDKRGMRLAAIARDLNNVVKLIDK